MRASNQRQIELEFVRREPLVVPKRSLTGSASEHVDTRETNEEQGETPFMTLRPPSNQLVVGQFYCQVIVG